MSELFPVRCWKLIDATGAVLDREATNRPSGPVLNNVQYYRGERWVLNGVDTDHDLV